MGESAPRILGHEIGGSWSKWTIALLVGAPVAFGVGCWYFQKRNRETDKSGSKSKCASIASGCQGDSLDGNIDPLSPPIVSAPKLPKTPIMKAHELKCDGNTFFKAGEYAEAIVCYTQAIETCPPDRKTELATFFQNRAAAYEKMKMYDSVRDDCTSALELHPRYIKALQRRAKACEVINDLQQSLEDITAACILEEFSNQTTLISADRILKELGRQHAKESTASRIPIMPSKNFIKTYFSSFSEDPIANSLAVEKDLNSTQDGIDGFARAKQEFIKQNYEQVIPACNEELGKKDSKHVTDALVLRATFRLLLGEHSLALADFKTVIDDCQANVKLRVNALIKRASLFIQLEQSKESLDDFNSAASLDPENSDVYHHRGQVHLLMEKITDAIQDFNKAVKINPDFPIAYVQKCYTDYRYALMTRNPVKKQDVMQSFKDAIKKFPKCSECYTLYAQVLSDQQEYEQSDENFKKAIEVEPENGTIYVHRGLLLLQWTGDVPRAISLINQAIAMDERCEFAFETLGTIEVQRGNLGHAVELFNKAIPLAKTELERSHLFSLRDAAAAQATIAQRMGIGAMTPA